MPKRSSQIDRTLKFEHNLTDVFGGRNRWLLASLQYKWGLHMFISPISRPNTNLLITTELPYNGHIVHCGIMSIITKRLQLRSKGLNQGPHSYLKWTTHSLVAVVWKYPVWCCNGRCWGINHPDTLQGYNNSPHIHPTVIWLSDDKDTAKQTLSLRW